MNEEVKGGLLTLLPDRAYQRSRANEESARDRLSQRRRSAGRFAAFRIAPPERSIGGVAEDADLRMFAKKGVLQWLMMPPTSPSRSLNLLRRSTTGPRSRACAARSTGFSRTGGCRRASSASKCRV